LVRGQSVSEGLLIDWVVEQPRPISRLPVTWLNREQTATELQRVQAERARLAAYEAELVVHLADDTPDTFDPPPDSAGAGRGGWTAEERLPGVSEFFVAELAMVLNCGRGTASHVAARAWTWRESLPATHAAMRAGELDEPRAKALAEVLDTALPEVARGIEAQLLPEAAGLSVGKLRKRALAALLAQDAAAVDERRRRVQRFADVRVYPSPLDGMATLAAELPAPEVAACFDLVDQLAAMVKSDGDPRPIGQLRAAVLSDLLRRPWDDSRPPVTAQLHVSAALPALIGHSAEPGEVSGLPITAGHVRELLARLQAGYPAAVSGPVAMTLAITDSDGRLLATTTARELARLARRGCRTHPDTDCSCPVLGAPADVNRYEPSAGQRVWVKTRDRTCRFPNCGQRVGWADLDHVIAHACGGETSCTNLCCLCRSHHRLKTFARGWRFTMAPDGMLTVTTPSGITRTTRPPRLRPPPAEPPPRPQPPPATDPPPRPVSPEDDPPPF
jgi:hypothetical protein